MSDSDMMDKLLRGWIRTARLNIAMLDVVRSNAIDLVTVLEGRDIFKNVDGYPGELDDQVSGIISSLKAIVLETSKIMVKLK